MWMIFEENKEFREFKESKVLKESRAFKESKVLKEKWDLKVFKVFKEIEVHKVYKGLKVCKDLLGWMLIPFKLPII